MSADFLLYSVPCCKLTDDRKQELLSIVRDFTVDDWEDLEQCIPSSDTEDLPEMLQAAIEAYVAAEDDRTITSVTFDGMTCWMYVAGGLSGGDYPYDACRHFDVLANCERLYDKLRIWAHADFANRVFENA